MHAIRPSRNPEICPPGDGRKMDENRRVSTFCLPQRLGQLHHSSKDYIVLSPQESLSIKTGLSFENG